MVLRCKRQTAGWEFAVENNWKNKGERRSREEHNSSSHAAREVVFLLLLLEIMLTLSQHRCASAPSSVACSRSKAASTTLVLGGAVSHRRECLRNGDFESWRGEAPLFWEGENFSLTSAAHSGAAAVELGRDPDREATLYQDFPVVAGQQLDFRFSTRSVLGTPVLCGRVEWLDREKNLLALGTEVVVSPSLPAGYRTYWRLTGRVPAPAVWGRVYFDKKGYGAVDVDDVSLIS
ncbi:hypothetical protein [Desulfothermobacter acidiphilus]|uniref:hypothetical protein n=1 Tax=Desulfothermobacter acidiphilus TaxID=1938353 RepID=UPI003F88B941